jgi:hypothetical protein
MFEEYPQPPMPEKNTEPDPYKEGLEEAEPTEISEENDGSQLVDEQLSVPSAPTPASLLPPEAQGETNGGPLGCCLGVTVGLLLSLSIAIVGRLYADTFATIFQGYLAITVRIIMVLVAIGAAILCGYFGWKIGKKAYREYDSPVIKNRTYKARPRKV